MGQVEMDSYEGGHGAVAEVDVGVEAGGERDWSIKDPHDEVRSGFLIFLRFDGPGELGTLG